MKRLLLVLPFMLVGCGSDPMPNDRIIAESNACAENGFNATLQRSGWDNEIINVQCTPKAEFRPTVTEYTLEDGTRCVVFYTRPKTYQAGFSGVSCNWKD